MKNSQNASGLSYLFDICTKSHSIEQIAQDKNTSPTAVKNAIESACTALHQQLLPILKPLMN